ncbi:5-oxoprolinase subunit PxpA [Aliidiomarina sanyensis]|uniref:5-oxoprolinase subunit PxpA n=1 Tax=Aliidiomarina sanyensis TaxID=1249555 RepID=UPI0026C3292B
MMVQLNCDLGESFGAWSMGDDAAVMAFIDEANIACGFHAGDPLTMEKTIALAKAHDVAIGAHPAYPDLEGFGRRSMALSEQEVYSNVLYQVGALSAFCRAQGVALRYVKPHGALYHDLLIQDATFRGVVRAIADFDATLPLVILAQQNPSHWQEQAAKYGVELRFEAFADRTYEDDGRLRSRREPGAVLLEPAQIVAQALQIAQFGTVTTYSGHTIALSADTLCVHGDTPSALDAVKQIRTALDALRTSAGEGI